MALTTRDLNPYDHTFPKSISLSPTFQQSKKCVSAASTAADFNYPIGFPMIYDESADLWEPYAGNHATDADKVTIRGFLIEDWRPAVGAESLAVIMLEGKMDYKDIPLTPEASTDGTAGTAVTEADLKDSLQGEKGGLTVAPQTSPRELNLTITGLEQTR